MNYLRLYRATDQAQEIDGQPGTPIIFIASTPGEKRDGKDLDQNRWYLENYRRNPVFLWVHDYWGNKLPIGRAAAYEEGGYLKCAVTFDQKDSFARQVEQKYRDSFLHAVSVGWDEIEADGRVMYDLLDISAVPVPGDPDALKERQVAGMRGIYQQIQKVLDEADDSPSADEPAPEQRAAQEETETVIELDLPEVAVEVDYEALSWALLRNYTAELGAYTDTAILKGGERAGAVISKKNLADLQQAADLITGVISRTAKAENPTTDEEDPDPEEEDGKRAAEADAPAPDDTRFEAADDVTVPDDDHDDGAVDILTRVARMFELQPG